MSVHDHGTIDRCGLAVDGTALLIVYCGGYMGEHYTINDIAEKVEAYLEFVLSGQLLEQVPASKDRPVVIQISCEYWPNRDYSAAFEKMAKQVAEYGIRFVVEVSSFHSTGGKFFPREDDRV